MHLIIPSLIFKTNLTLATEKHFLNSSLGVYLHQKDRALKPNLVQLCIHSDVECSVNGVKYNMKYTVEETEPVISNFEGHTTSYTTGSHVIWLF